MQHVFAQHSVQLLTLIWLKQSVLGSQAQDGRWTPSDRFADIRVDEDYERFYRAQAASGKKLPPPLESTTLYDRGSNLNAQAQAALAARLQGVNGLNGTNKKVCTCQQSVL